MKFFLTITILLLCSQARAQQPQYFILFVKGEVMMKQPGHSIKKAMVLQLLSLHDSILLNTDQSGITIANTTGTRTELKGAGKYKVTDIQIKETSKGPGASSKFFAFLYDELLHPKKGFNQQSIAASWGGGSRGSGVIPKWPMNGLVSSKDSIIFKWNHISKMPDYNFILYDNSENEIINCNVRDTQIVINTINLRSGDKKRYFWRISPTGQSGRDQVKYYFELVSKVEEEKMANTLIKDIPISMNETLYQLEIADKLGRNGLVEMALKYFGKANILFKKRD